MNKNKIDINAEKRLYYNLNNKLTSRIKKNDKYNDVLADISEKVGFDNFKLSTKVFGSSFTKYEHLMLKMDTTKSIGEKNKIIESLLMGIDRDFADIGSISVKGFSKSFKKNILSKISYISYYDSNDEYKIYDKETGIERLTDLKDHLGMSDREAYDLWFKDWDKLKPSYLQDVEITFKEFLEFS